VQETPFSGALYKGTMGLVLVLDLTASDGLEQVDRQLASIQRVLKPENFCAIPKVLVGNKVT